MIETWLIKRSISDFFSAKILTLCIAPFFVTFAILILLYSIFGADFIQHFTTSMDNGVVPFLDPQKYPTITYILTSSLFKWIFYIFFYTVFVLLITLLTVTISIVVVGFFTPIVVKIIQKRHYRDFIIDTSGFSILYSLFYSIKTITLFLLIFIVVLPFLFIPAINFIAINIPFYYLFHNFLVFDTGSSILNKEQYEDIVKKYKLLFRGTTLSLYGLSLIPLFGVLFQVFFVIVLSHQFFTKGIEGRV